MARSTFLPFSSYTNLLKWMYAHLLILILTSKRTSPVNDKAAFVKGTVSWSYLTWQGPNGQENTSSTLVVKGQKKKWDLNVAIFSKLNKNTCIILNE
jgi:hypothetical protein